LAGAGVAVHARQRLDVLGGLLEALVFLQSTHQFGARIGFLVFARTGGRGSSRRDLISARIAAITRYSAASSKRSSCISVDVADVLFGDLRDRDVEDVEVLAADQVQQQVERTLRRPRG
jgi:hypothetical protein